MGRAMTLQTEQKTTPEQVNAWVAEVHPGATTLADLYVAHGQGHTGVFDALAARMAHL